ncbi:hypothetical protein, partial [Tsukamurella paurometabola]
MGAVVVPGDAGRAVPALDPFDRTVDRELLEHEVDPGAADPGRGLEGDRRLPSARLVLGEGGEDAVHLLRIGDGR